ncbi:CPBP family intramembrane glutamic endopeptidase [Candidatus Contubernalis alkalaceticus]|nr:CPBP family intramembrane metalloprotease [Candidatus Contubernalis alkalaceticus]
MVFFLIYLVFGPIPEELRWRGYGIDSLRSRFNFFTASLVMSII